MSAQEWHEWTYSGDSAGHEFEIRQHGEPTGTVSEEWMAVALVDEMNRRSNGGRRELGS